MSIDPLRWERDASRGRPSIAGELLRVLREHLDEADRPSAGLEPTALELSRASIEAPLTGLLARPSKGFRSKLTSLGFGLADGEGEAPPVLAAIVELLHAGSLVVDDIEDGSVERRGRPTVHLEHGVPIALNAANYLYFVPFALVDSLDLPPERKLSILGRLTDTLLRCHRGQGLDLSVQIGRLARRDVPGVVHSTSLLKTGALVELALVLGAEIAGASPARIEALARFGRDVGVGLQMLDDASSVTVRARRAKGLEDVRLGRPTWAWAWLAPELDALGYAKLAAMSRRASEDPASAEELLDALALALGMRGVERAEGRLGSALETLRSEIGPHPLLSIVARELASLGRSYG